MKFKIRFSFSLSAYLVLDGGSSLRTLNYKSTPAILEADDASDIMGVAWEYAVKEAKWQANLEQEQSAIVTRVKRVDVTSITPIEG